MGDVELPSPEDIAEQRNDAFTRMVALTVAGYAVLLAFTSLGGSNAGKEVNLNQQQASNQWAYYQAKVIREHEYRIQKLRLQFDLAAHAGTMSAEVKAQGEKLLADLEKQEKTYNGEKKEIEAKAREHEQIRDVNMQRDPYFDYSEVLLQIAIVIASVSMLATSRPVFLFSIVFAVSGTFLMLNGFFLFVQVPFLS